MAKGDGEEDSPEDDDGKDEDDMEVDGAVELAACSVLSLISFFARLCAIAMRVVSEPDMSLVTHFAEEEVREGAEEAVVGGIWYARKK